MKKKSPTKKPSKKSKKQKAASYRLIRERKGPGQGQRTRFEALDEKGKVLWMEIGAKANTYAQRIRSGGLQVEEIVVTEKGTRHIPQE
jgi:hypothetical protein